MKVNHAGVDPTTIRPNAWNYNRMSQSMLEKARASVTEFGFIDPIHVRALPAGDAHRFEIIDGEHRHIVATERSMPIDCIELRTPENEPLDNRRAKKLTIIFRDLHGEPQYDRLGKLLAELDAEGGHLDLLRDLPFPDAELKSLIGLHRMPEYEVPDMTAGDEADEDRDPVEDWAQLAIRVPPGAVEVFDKAIAAATADTRKMPREVRRGVGLEIIAQAFLTAQRAAGKPVPKAPPKKKEPPQKPNRSRTKRVAPQ